MDRSNKLILLPSIVALFAVLTIASSASAQVIGAGPSGGTRAITTTPTEGPSSVGSLWLQIMTFRHAGLGFWLGTQLRSTKIDPMSPAPLGQRSFVFVSQFRVKAGRP